MRRIFGALIALVCLALMATAPGASRILADYTAISFDMAPTNYATPTEIVRINTTQGSTLADRMLIRMRVNGAAGGTNATLYLRPVWTANAAADTATSVGLTFNPPSGSSGATLQTTTGADTTLIAEALWGTFGLRGTMPPQISVQLVENRTAGTVSVDVILTEF